MKKWLSMILAVLLVCGSAFSGAMAEEQDFYEYTVKADGTVEITGVSTDCTDEVIPKELGGKTVTSIGGGAYSNCRKLKNIVIPDTVTTIGYYVFSSCNLNSITIPDSVSSIDEAFCPWGKVKTINISREHPYLAYNNGALISKKDMKLIRFFGASGNEYDVNWGIKTIADYAFCGAKLQTVNLPDSVTSIGHQAFAECTTLKNIYIPSGITYIGTQAFFCCKGLKSVKLADKVTEMGDNVFAYCDNLKEVVISENNPAFEIRNNAVIDKRANKLLFTYGIKNGVYTIPEGVKSLKDLAFAGMNLTSVILPEGLTAISEGEFYSCSKLKEITIPEGVTSIAGRAFKNCGQLAKVVIPASVNKINDSAFEGCKKLTCTVEEGSYAQKYCEEKGIKYVIK